MKPASSEFSDEDVLDAFCLEPLHDSATLQRYLGDYPRIASQLLDLSRELSRFIDQDDTTLSENDRILIENAWKKHSGITARTVSDPLSDLSVPELRHLSGYLGVPRQIITAFRERKVLVSSIPAQFLAKFASALQTSVEAFSQALEVPPSFISARSYKADDKPKGSLPVSFERLLIDAGVSEEIRTRLLEGEE